MKRLFFIFSLVALIFGCSDSEKSNGLAIQTDLKSVLNQTLPVVPVVTFNLKKADGTSIEGADLRIRIEQGIQRITAAQGLTDVDGNLLLSLAAGAYELEIRGLADVADYTGAITVSDAVAQTISLQTEQRSFQMDAGEAIDETDLRVYQSLGGGSYDRVYRDNARNLAGALNHSVPVEVFPGSYFATAEAIKTAGGDTPLVKTAMFNAAAAATATSSMDLSIPGIALIVTLQDVAGAPLQNYDVLAYDKGVNLRFARQSTDASGVATILLGASTDTAIILEDDQGEVVGIKDLGAVSADVSHTYQMHTVTGAVTPPTGLVLAVGDAANITVKLSSALAATLDDNAGANISRNDIVMTPETGAFTVDLFDSAFSFGAEDVAGFPTVTATAVTLAGADLANQNINVNLGGVIRGSVLTQATAPVIGIGIAVLSNHVLTDPDPQWIAGGGTDVDGVFAIEVPYGTYDLYVEGAVTRDVTVSAAANDQVVNLTQYAVTGRVTNALGAGVSADVDVIDGDSTATDGLGVYTINVVEGVNQLCFTAAAGMSCEFNVLFDDATVAKIQ